MPEYDAENYDPPAPVASVTLRNPATGDVVVNVPMLIDTGSDATLLPLDAVEKLGMKAEENTGFEVQVFDGDTKFLRLVKLDLLFLNRIFKGDYLLVNRPIGVLGRNILKNLRILFDGPGGEWGEHK